MLGFWKGPCLHTLDTGNDYNTKKLIPHNTVHFKLLKLNNKFDNIQ